MILFLNFLDNCKIFVDIRFILAASWFRNMLLLEESFSRLGLKERNSGDERLYFYDCATDNEKRWKVKCCQVMYAFKNILHLLCPSGLTATDTTPSWCPFKVWTRSNWWCSNCHTFTSLSNPPVTMKTLCENIISTVTLTMMMILMMLWGWAGLTCGQPNHRVYASEQETSPWLTVAKMETK